jgi:hypothetical protein
LGTVEWYDGASEVYDGAAERIEAVSKSSGLMVSMAAGA